MDLKRMRLVSSREEGELTWVLIVILLLLSFKFLQEMQEHRTIVAHLLAMPFSFSITADKSTGTQTRGET